MSSALLLLLTMYNYTANQVVSIEVPCFSDSVEARVVVEYEIDEGAHGSDLVRWAPRLEVMDGSLEEIQRNVLHEIWGIDAKSIDQGSDILFSTMVSAIQDVFPISVSGRYSSIFIEAESIDDAVSGLNQSVHHFCRNFEEKYEKSISKFFYDSVHRGTMLDDVTYLILAAAVDGLSIDEYRATPSLSQEQRLTVIKDLSVVEDR